jgi:TRAP transporter TAXI family solute receptor
MRRTATAAATLVLAGGLTACGGRQDAASTDAGGTVTCKVTEDTRVGIATGNATGVYFALGNAFAEQIDAAGGRLKATPAETGASVQNIQQVVAGTYNVAFSLADTAADAINGTGSFTTKQPIAALARIHTNYTQVIVRKAAGIKDVAGMRGKRVSTGSPKSGTEVIANRILTAAGLDPAKDISAQKLDLTKTVDGIKDGSIDAFFWSGGLPTKEIVQLAHDLDIRLLDMSDVMPKIRAKFGYYSSATIPITTYALKNTAPVTTLLVPNLLLVTDEMSVPAAKALTQGVFDAQQKLATSNTAARSIDIRSAIETQPVPLHEGALEYYRDNKV